MKLDKSAAIEVVGYHVNGEDVEYRSGEGVGQIFLEENYLGDRTERTVVIWSHHEAFKVAEIPAGKCNYIYYQPSVDKDSATLNGQAGDGA